MRAIVFGVVSRGNTYFSGLWESKAQRRRETAKSFDLGMDQDHRTGISGSHSYEERKNKLNVDDS